MHIEIGIVTGKSVELRGPQTAIVSWDLLRTAARQDDPELRAVYGDALDHAERIRAGQIDQEIDACSSLIVRYGQDSSNVWWICWVKTPSGLAVGRRWRTMSLFAREEGGTYAQAWMARQEAESVAARIRAIGGTAIVVAS